MKQERREQVAGTVAVFASFQGPGQRVLSGLVKWAQQYPQLVLHAHCPAEFSSIQCFDETPFDAAVVVDTGDPLPESLQQLTIPVVRVFDRPAGCKDTLVGVDHEEIGHLAAQHLHGRGFRHVAFVGGMDAPFAKVRYEAFKRYLDQQGVSFHLFGEGFPSRDRAVQQSVQLSTFRERLKVWLRSLPKPVGICALDDWKAFETQMLCRQLDIAVPEQVALVGVNDDELPCQLSHPNLTSIRLPLESMGFEAGNCIHALLTTGRASDKILRCVGLLTRGSSNTFSVGDAVVAQALRFMQMHCHKPIRIENVLQHVGVSRSLLERRFRSEIARTPLMELRRQRVERARELLADTDLAIQKIAELTGFASNIRFTTVFREQMGITPTEFREQMRGWEVDDVAIAREPHPA